LSPLADWAACGGVILNAEAYAIHEATCALASPITARFSGIAWCSQG